MTTIIIPPINREQLIGYALSHVCRVMHETEYAFANNGDPVTWDFSNCKFLHPFLLGALAILKKQYGERVICSNIIPALRDYLNLIFFHAPLGVDAEGENDIWKRYLCKTYIPICEFDPRNKSSIKAQELVQTTVKAQLGGKIHYVLSYLLSELIDNITDHSHSEKGYVFCQAIPRMNALYVFIADTGHSIYSSYATDERYSASLDEHESSALLLALNGRSTKNRPESENRGYGISKSRNLVVHGLGGEFCILSGSALARHDATGETVFDLPDDLRWNGTIAILKIPTLVPSNLNLYYYIS